MRKTKLHTIDGPSKNPLIFQLPNHIIVEIFCKTQTKTLIQCKCVCKSWRRLLSDPHFTKDLLSRTPTCLLVRDIRRPSPENPKCLSINHFLLDPNNNNNRNSISTPEEVALKLSNDQNLQSFGIRIVGSCNGILCLFGTRTRLPSLLVSNPITGESLALPTPYKHVDNDYTYVGGFGFSTISNVYKLVLIKMPTKGLMKPEIMVMTIGSRTWRSIGDSVSGAIGNEDGIYLNGFLHWLGECSKGSLSICAFDVEIECFQLFPVPPCCSCSDSENPPAFNLGIFQGWLSVTVHLANKINVWVRKDYDVKGSWTHELQIIGSVPLISATPAQVLKLTEEGQVLLLEEFYFRAYTPKTKQLVAVEIRGLTWAAAAYVYVPSFVSLEHAIRG